MIDRVSACSVAAGFSESEPSIAAVVGSMDRYLAKYAAEVHLQPHRLEIIQVHRLQLLTSFQASFPST